MPHLTALLGLVLCAFAGGQTAKDTTPALSNAGGIPDGHFVAAVKLAAEKRIFSQTILVHRSENDPNGENISFEPLPVDVGLPEGSARWKVEVRFTDDPKRQPEVIVTQPKSLAAATETADADLSKAAVAACECMARCGLTNPPFTIGTWKHQINDRFTVAFGHWPRKASNGQYKLTFGGSSVEVDREFHAGSVFTGH